MVEHYTASALTYASRVLFLFALTKGFTGLVTNLGCHERWSPGTELNEHDQLSPLTRSAIDHPACGLVFLPFHPELLRRRKPIGISGNGVMSMRLADVLRS